MKFSPYDSHIHLVSTG